MELWSKYPRGFVATIVLLLTVVAYMHANITENGSVLQLTIPLGMLGAVLREYASLLNNQDNAIQPNIFVFSVLMGGVLSLLMTLLFASGLVAGELFPNLTGGDQTVESIQNALRGGVNVATHADFYKLLLWSLVAGFADRFVLDKLNKLTNSKK